MIWSWLSERRRGKILEEPFPDEWRVFIRRNVAHVAALDADEQTRLWQLVQVFVAEKRWEGVGGLEMTAEIQATIAAQACLLILGLDHDMYRRVESIVVYPSTVYAPKPVQSMFAVTREVVTGPTAILGQAFARGPVILVWDAVKAGGINPSDGRNVVYHEFAHKLDMLSGGADGVPPIDDPETYERWISVFEREYQALAQASAQGRRTYLDTYALHNGPEFFAVATEHFFEQPVRMQRDHRDMYELLAGFYRQDPAARMRRGRRRR